MEGKQKLAKNILSSGGFKIALLAVLILLLLIPVNMIRGLVRERSHRADSVEMEIMEAWGSALVLYGPVIRIPVIERNEVITKTERDGEKIEVVMTNKTFWLTPKNVDISANLSAEKKRRGIFSVALFSGDISLKGSFSFERAKDEIKQNEQLFPEQAEIIIGLTNQKGIRRIIKADWNGNELFFKPGNLNFSVDSANNGVNALSPFDITGVNTFDIQFAIQGGKSLRTLPIGETTTTSIISDWVSPSFQGGFLPASYTLSENGFDAEWEVSYLSRSIPLFWTAGERGEGNPKLSQRGDFFGVDFFKPLDHYALNERAVKYAILFLFIPFLTLFFLEVFSRKSIHPAQYLLSGFANVIFYLLVLSISEHLSFSLAYLIAAASITGMLILYASSLLESWARSGYMALVMALLYLILYLTLNAEDWALLIGSIAAFLICGLVMFLTRKLDWSNLNIKPGTENEKPPGNN
ncbi:MAG: cell envelope integrity protein CreD [Treponema sp.]|jgi:inner membrane protein|nr:cell envelope integrity protein CreD [Treponema sp.]